MSVQTSNGGNLAAGLIAAEGGSITLKSPTGQLLKLYYAALGIGLGVGISMPKLGRYKNAAEEHHLAAAFRARKQLIAEGSPHQVCPRPTLLTRHASAAYGCTR